jgi:hypothetical protein
MAELNSPNNVLLPNKERGEDIGDYRNISLIDTIVKIIARMIAI